MVQNMVKGRFAPSPTGRMHLGNIYSALIAWLSARCQNGGFILRLEDIDRQRSREEYAEKIEDDLKWLGIDWDEKYIQSERYGEYEKYLSFLQKEGRVYQCYCTRADIMATNAPHETDGRVVYKGTCRPENLKRDFMTERKGAIRLRVPDEEIAFTDRHYGSHSINLERQCGDFILRRADGAWAYQLAVVVDDATMGVTEVVRGRDLLLSVPQQIFLYRTLGFQSPQFAHIPLLCNDAGQRLSKRDKSLSLGELRENFHAEEIVGKLAYYAGILTQPEPVSPSELISVFDWKKIPFDDIVTGLSI